MVSMQNKKLIVTDIHVKIGLFLSLNDWRVGEDQVLSDPIRSSGTHVYSTRRTPTIKFTVLAIQLEVRQFYYQYQTDVPS